MSRILHKSMANFPLTFGEFTHPMGIIVDDVEGSLIIEEQECEVLESKQIENVSDTLNKIGLTKLSKMMEV